MGIILKLSLLSNRKIIQNVPNKIVPNPCMTLDNTVCVFPFKYNDVEYYKCTYASSPTPWCATKVDANGTVVINNWGDCANTQTSACPVEDLTKPSCTAISGESCVFPFRYQGIVYNKCADVSITGIDNNHNYNYYNNCSHCKCKFSKQLAKLFVKL